MTIAVDMGRKATKQTNKTIALRMQSFKIYEIIHVFSCTIAVTFAGSGGSSFKAQCLFFQEHSNSYLEILKSKYIKDSNEFGLVLAWISTLIDSIDKPGKRPRVKALGNGMAIIRRLKYTSNIIMETFIQLQVYK